MFIISQIPITVTCDYFEGNNLFAVILFKPEKYWKICKNYWII